MADTVYLLLRLYDTVHKHRRAKGDGPHVLFPVERVLKHTVLPNAHMIAVSREPKKDACVIHVRTCIFSIIVLGSAKISLYGQCCLTSIGVHHPQILT